METLILALLATPLVFSLVMAFLPKNTSYNVFAGLNLVSVAAVLVLSIMTAGDVLMSGDTASRDGKGDLSDLLQELRILLQGVENADIGTVQFAHETKSPVYYVYADFLSSNDLKRNETERNILLLRAYDCCRTRFLRPEG